MPLTVTADAAQNWRVQKIAVIGPGIVGMPMAALLADAEVRIGTTEPAPVVVVQRRSPTSGWKVDAINAGRSPIGGVEPALDEVVRRAVARKLLRATDDYADLADADAILVCVQTDKRGDGPDYGPLFEALDGIAGALVRRPAGNVPLVVFESTLAPSSMTTVVREHFARFGLVEGRDVLLGNSPNRVMPGRLVERVRTSDKLAAGLHPATPGLVARLYRHVVTDARVEQTNSLTAEIVKTLENAYRDVRIAFASELAAHCDARDIDFFALRDALNERLARADASTADAEAVPTGALLVPTVGVGGHCLPKDGVLLWWRARDGGEDPGLSLILAARGVNAASPQRTVALAERAFGPIAGRRVAVLGAAYRFNSEDTRNSPGLALADELRALGCPLVVHDPYVAPHDQNIVRQGYAEQLTADLDAALRSAEVVFVCVAHRDYHAAGDRVLGSGASVVDGCNVYARADAERLGAPYAGIGRGRRAPDRALVDEAEAAFRAVERGVANEVARLVRFFNAHYAHDDFSTVRLDEVRRLAATCPTGCDIVAPGPVAVLPGAAPFPSELAALALRLSAPAVHEASRAALPRAARGAHAGHEAAT